MSKETLDFKEAVSLFLERTMTDLKNGSEIPPLNIVFPESAFKLFEYINPVFENDKFELTSDFVAEISIAQILVAFVKAKLNNKEIL
jgi:hypothetical protein